MYHFNVHLEIEFKLAFRDLRRHMVNDHFYYEFYGRRQKTEHKTIQDSASLAPDKAKVRAVAKADQ